MAEIRRIAIVGGGTSGWMTASLLAKQLGGDVEITLVESEGVPTVGVGEATIIHMTAFLKAMGLSERDWMRACNATYKEGIRFRGFYDRDQEYWHPFQDAVDGAHVTNFWVYRHLTEGLPVESYFERCYPNTVLNAANRVNEASKVNLDAVRDVADYTYHLEASAFHRLLRDRIALPLGVRHLVDDVIDARVGADGNVEAVVTRGHGDLTADLFVDCTGFRSLLIEGALGEEFVDCRHILPNDRAIAARMPYVDPESELHPYTSATALEAGWVWHIPLFSRIGTGYVYSSRYRSPEEAESEFRAHLGEERARDLEMHHIQMRVGHHRRAWVGNVVAIGLAMGFVEPLESTGIELSQIGAEFLLWALAIRRESSFVTRTLYNRAVLERYAEILDFLQLHYALTVREDSEYWRDLKHHDHELRDGLTEKLIRYRRGFGEPEPAPVFKETSWHTLLVGFRYLPRLADIGQPRPADLSRMSAIMDEAHRVATQRAATQGSHRDFLRTHIYTEA
jgi:flavin-dependent dehydrogenase